MSSLRLRRPSRVWHVRLLLRQDAGDSFFSPFRLREPRKLGCGTVGYLGTVEKYSTGTNG